MIDELRFLCAAWHATFERLSVTCQSTDSTPVSPHSSITLQIRDTIRLLPKYGRRCTPEDHAVSNSHSKQRLQYLDNQKEGASVSQEAKSYTPNETCT